MKRLLVTLAAVSVLVTTIAFISLIYIERQDRAEQRFFDLFPNWWASHTACIPLNEELKFIRQLAPDIAARIDSANAEFEELAAREVVGTLTVSEREAYLDHHLRVPHLVQTGSEWYDWTEVDPRAPFSQHESEGPLVRQCPVDDHSHGWQIKNCFGYVNINLGFIGQHPGGGHFAPTVLGREVYRNLEQLGETRDFVLQMTEHHGDQVALSKQAEQLVADLPASEVSAGFEERRVQAEYERLRCVD